MFARPFDGILRIGLVFWFALLVCAPRLRGEGPGGRPAYQLVAVPIIFESKAEERRGGSRLETGGIAFSAADAKSPAMRATLPEGLEFGRGALGIASASGIERE